MLTMDVRHPDIEKFIEVKKDLTKVTGANISVMLRDDFMKAVHEDGDYILRFPCEMQIPEYENFENFDYNTIIEYSVENASTNTLEINGFVRKVKAKQIWDKLIDAAHASAEPGIMFVDKHWDYSPDTVYPRYKGITTNPCGEIFMGMYDACRLICLNLYSFVTNPFSKDAKLDERKLYQVAYSQQKLADDIIDLEIEHIDRILDKIKSEDNIELYANELRLWENIRKITEGGRRTGCGFTALGDMLAALNLKYDSKEAIEVIEKVMRIKMRAELNCAIQMGKDRGVFEGWDKSLEYDIKEITDGKITKGKNQFYQFLLENYTTEVFTMCQQGRRNVSWSTVAPTGSVSILTQTTSGLEPLFAPFYMRRKKVNPGENVRVDFVDPNGDSWMEYPILHPKFKDWMLMYPDLWMNSSIPSPERDGDGWIYSVTKDLMENAFRQSPWYNSTANDIDWAKRVEIQGLIQKYTTHSISSTINLPNSATTDEIQTIYSESWVKGLKGVTVYRDGCRTGVLVNTNTPSKQEGFDYKDAPKRPETLNCDIYRTRVKGNPFTVVVGLLDEKPYEVFAIPALLMEGFDSGILTKKARGVYNLTCSLDKELSIIKDITKDMTDEQEVITRLISTSLRHGANIKFIVEQISKTDGELHSFTKAIARILKGYIPDGSESTLTCNDCGSKSIVFEEGCSKCKECGSSKCG